MSKRAIVSSQGPTVWVGDESQICFVCQQYQQAISIESSLPIFESEKGRPCTHLCVNCAATAASSTIELINGLLNEQLLHNRQLKKRDPK